MDGTWRAWFVQDPDNEMTLYPFTHVVFRLQVRDNTLTGTVSAGTLLPEGTPISNATIDGDRFTFEGIGTSTMWRDPYSGERRCCPKWILSGFVQGDVMLLTWVRCWRSSTRPWPCRASAAKSASAQARPMRAASSKPRAAAATSPCPMLANAVAHSQRPRVESHRLLTDEVSGGGQSVEIGGVERRVAVGLDEPGVRVGPGFAVEGRTAARRSVLGSSRAHASEHAPNTYSRGSV
jgi:hypothetical protein